MMMPGSSRGQQIAATGRQLFINSNEEDSINILRKEAQDTHELLSSAVSEPRPDQLDCIDIDAIIQFSENNIPESGTENLGIENIQDCETMFKTKRHKDQ